MDFKNDMDLAKRLDSEDELSSFRTEFLFPEGKGGPVLYFTGNSLGLEPKGAKKALEQELEDWAEFGVEGHFEARNPWFSYHHMFKEPLAEVVGAKPVEVTAMNSLTADLHLLMVSFYQPTSKRYRIICEKKAFPSDQYALESQARFHGFDPDDAIVEVGPREGEHNIRTEDIVATIEEYKDSLALVMFGGVNYYTGQAFDIPAITSSGHQAGAYVGFDLAHAAGNLLLDLHDDGVDFAVWCSYKYLNSGPGSVGGIFVHEKHADRSDFPRFAGWWGHDEKERFKMEKGFRPMRGADGWQLSNAPVLAMAVHKVALDLFRKAGMKRLARKRDQLTAFLEFILDDISRRRNDLDIEMITPRDKEHRGAQLSILAHGQGKALQEALLEENVIVDFREPNVIRAAPVPLYNSFRDVFEFGRAMERALDKVSA